MIIKISVTQYLDDFNHWLKFENIKCDDFLPLDHDSFSKNIKVALLKTLTSINKAAEKWVGPEKDSKV